GRPLHADLRDEQVPAITLLLLRGQHPRDDEVEAGLLPGAVPARHRGDVGVPELLESARGERRARAAGAIQGDRRVALGDRVLDAGLDEPLAQMPGAGDVALVEFAALADVDEGAGARGSAHLLRREFLDGAARVVEEVARGLGHGTSLPKT